MSKSNIDHQNRQLQNNVSGKGILAEFDCPCCRVKQQIPADPEFRRRKNTS